jgi:hypothetical protein
LTNVYTFYIRLLALDAHFVFAGLRFRWDLEKANSNFAKHGIRFEHACEVFFDPFVHMLDAAADEAREAALGLTEDWTLLFVVHAVRENEVIRIISARLATPAERRIYEDE